jgi:PAS domain S-box-containing protein
MTKTAPKPRPAQPPTFISLRWRLLFPVTLAVMLVAMLGAYSIASSLTTNYSVAEDNVLRQSAEAVMNRTQEIFVFQRDEAVRVAYTEGVAEAVIAAQSDSLVPVLESLAAVSNLDSIVVTNSRGLEMLGLVRVQTQNLNDYSVSSNSDLSGEILISSVLSGQAVATSLVRTAEGIMLYTAVPMIKDNLTVGVAMVGQRLGTVVDMLKSSSVADVVLYTPEGDVGATTFELTDMNLPDLALNEGVRNQTFSSNSALQSAVTLEGALYRVVYAPFAVGQNTLGIVGTYVSNNVPFATEIGRQTVSLFASTLTAVVVIVSYMGIARMIIRMDKITLTAQALSAGKAESRTGMKAVDEVGAIGVALDQFAQTTQNREDQFKTMLRRERRERNYLLNVLESIPDGVVVQDAQGKVLVLNDKARQLLGTQEAFQASPLNIESALNSVMGSSIAPGIYALGKPQQVTHNGTMLSAQAAAVVSPSQERLGTVVIMRDITQQVQQENARDEMLSKLQSEIEQPLFDSVQTGAQSPNGMVNEFAREISRHAAALQKMIVDMRELTRYNRSQARVVQRVLSVETLVWAVANDWRQIAQTANLTLQVQIDKTGLLVLGDESRLRLALGNIVDNAIKYTPVGGTIMLEIKDEIEGAVHLRIRDNGVGFSSDDLANAFMPFYRGTPRSHDGQFIHVPGMGQGLPIAKQIIEAHGGILRIKSKLGVGSAVYVALPVTSGVGFQLPLGQADLMDGDTVMIPENVDIESYWKRK